MSILNLKRLSLGTQGTSPSLVFMDTTATLSEITAPGFIGTSNEYSAERLQPGDFIFANYYPEGSQSIFGVSFGANGVITLTTDVDPPSFFNTIDVFSVAKNGDNTNSGLNPNEPLQTIEAAFAKMTDNTKLYVVNVLDSGPYFLTSNLSPGCTFILNIPNALLILDDKHIKARDGFTGFVNAFLMETLGAASVGYIAENSLLYIYAKSEVIGGMLADNGNIHAEGPSLTSDLTSQNSGFFYCNFDRFAGSIPEDTKIVSGKLGNKYCGEVEFNSTVTGAAYPANISVSGITPARAELRWGNNVIKVIGTNDVFVILPQFSADPTIKKGFQFYIVQMGSAKAIIGPEGSETIIAYDGISSTQGPGSVLKVMKVDDTVWSVSGGIPAGSSFSGVNSYYFSSNGSDSNSGTSASAPKQTLQATVSGVADPLGSNLITCLDSNEYLFGVPYVWPSTGQWILNAPGAIFRRTSGVVFSFPDTSNVIITCNEIRTSTSNVAVELTSATSKVSMTVNEFNGGVTGVSGSQLSFKCNGAMVGDFNAPFGALWETDIALSGGTTFPTTAYMGGKSSQPLNYGIFMGDVVTTSEYGVYNHGAKRPQKVGNGVDGFLTALNYGGIVFMNSASVQDFNLPTSEDIPFPEGTYVDVIQCGPGRVRFIKGQFSDVILSKQGENCQTNGQGAWARVVLRITGERSGTGITEWVIYGDLDPQP